LKQNANAYRDAGNVSMQSTKLQLIMYDINNTQSAE